MVGGEIGPKVEDAVVRVVERVVALVGADELGLLELVHILVAGDPEYWDSIDTKVPKEDSASVAKLAGSLACLPLGRFELQSKAKLLPVNKIVERSYFLGLRNWMVDNFQGIQMTACFVEYFEIRDHNHLAHSQDYNRVVALLVDIRDRLGSQVAFVQEVRS